MPNNTILTPDIIAREALMVLRNNAVMANLGHRAEGLVRRKWFLPVLS